MKISTVCVTCNVTFERFAAFHRHAEKRGSAIKFCSRECTDKARSSGDIGAKKRRGTVLACEVCASNFYRSRSKVAAGKTRFCSEECRMKAHQQKLVDRTGPRVNRRLGDQIPCTICGRMKYRKKSTIERGNDKTCGSQKCVSAYGRSLWGLEPRSDEDLSKPRPVRKRRPHEFRRKDRIEWIGTECKKCGATENLTLDHVIPVCQGGTSTRNNAQTLCGACNNWKALYEDRYYKGRNPDQAASLVNR